MIIVNLQVILTSPEVKSHDDCSFKSNFDITRGRRGDVPWGQTVFGSESHRTGGKWFNKFGPTKIK